MKLKTTELQGPALDWAVAQAEGNVRLQYDNKEGLIINNIIGWFHYRPSVAWAQGGPIIERENINVFMDDEKWAAYASHSLPQNFYGTSKDPDWDDGDEGYPLVAAMRCYVASVLGDEVEVPDEIL